VTYLDKNLNTTRAHSASSSTSTVICRHLASWGVYLHKVNQWLYSALN